MAKRKAIDLAAVRQARANLRRIAKEHPELVGPPSVANRAGWESTLEGMMENRTSLTAARLSEIERRCAAASRAPWKSYVEGRDHASGSSFIRTGGSRAARGADIELTGATVADQDFIAAARQDVPALLAEVRRLKRLVDSRKAARARK
jgi:hypothetical protein